MIASTVNFLTWDPHVNLGALISLGTWFWILARWIVRTVRHKVGELQTRFETIDRLADDLDTVKADVAGIKTTVNAHDVVIAQLACLERPREPNAPC